ncbi:hypothetical protein [Fulvimonas soli]|jgi:hypothetical protein|uniref:Serine/threonine protein kinase n=1 Tax=Fulvimonas soli TaxID=155197 RepID=A0A316IHD9_9GAMM|nr:hypothetical protein [Fulvimonas soli]PWK92086.1 hypothetical protein C7456_103205 [Fulvimonas soli]TNY26822.1 hypothetical protein BV497_06720 [Fulvimonas soli]
MELDEMKQAWQALDRRLAEQAALYRAIHRGQGMDRLRRGLRPLAWGQYVQIAFGVAAMLWGVSFWTTHLDVLHHVLCGAAVQAFGIVMVAFAGRLLFLLREIDHAAPVLENQRRLAALRAWRVRVEAPVFAVLGAVVWVPAALMLVQYGFDRWGDDYWNHAPWLTGHFVFSGLVSLALVLLAYALIRRAGRRRWLEDNFAGGAVRKAEAMLEEIARFERG